MSGLKRTFDIKGEPSSSKRVRFDKRTKSSSSADDTEFEFNHEDELEERKKRRGAVNFDVYDSDDEEVGGGIYSSSDSDDEKEKEESTTKIPSGEDFDMFGATESSNDGKGKATNKRAKQEIEGQEFDSYDRDAIDDDDDDDDDIENGQPKGPKITAFNMKEELEEGSVDENGNYVRNKVDPQAFHDKWMEGISRKDMNKAKEAHERREREEALKEAERQATIPQTKTDVYRALVEYLKPGQSVQEALTSLANSLPKKLPAWKQKMLEKKNKNKKAKDTEPQLTEDEESSRRKKVEAITGLADQMMALGHFNIYDDTFEMMVRYLRREGSVAQDWLPDTTK
ncbi:uncharacterized protein BX663DRAFT_552369 [Cokeromyces recurvatus]|uniref:uncharacterized protein n=1 Tax=Cokeromyces recurvatus TaxID=90255 RepID=UPI00221F25EC|nr:uncharacterized protein BX663DRAFT_552369 [Cokeromyces recurvatus]KAI7902454.1 hypothetical protein BX663DRAFT_552369 [Cokeromyces recurvatus]